MGLESGDADGWPATDWIENLVLADAGAETYDAWTFHELPFDSPPIRRAFERFGESSSPKARSAADPRVLPRTFFDEAQLPMLEDPPGCWLYLFPTFAAALLDAPGSIGRADRHVPLPADEGRVRRSDRRWRDDRRVLRPAGGPGSAPVPPQSRARRGVGGAGIEFMSPNRDFDLGHYQPFVRPHAEVLQDALARRTRSGSTHPT